MCRCLGFLLPPPSCTPLCCRRWDLASPRSPSARQASRSCHHNCWTCCAGDGRFPPPKRPASSDSARHGTRAPLSRTSSNTGACCAMSPTTACTSTRRSSKTSSTAARSPHRTERAKSTGLSWRASPTLNLAAAPVHHKHLTVHVASGVGGQEQDGAGDLFGQPDPPHRILSEHPVQDRLVAHSASAKRVFTRPGATALTRTVPPSSRASCLVSMITPALVTL